MNAKRIHYTDYFSICTIENDSVIVLALEETIEAAMAIRRLFNALGVKTYIGAKLD